jgi:uncharacterized membrane protein YedE/YeeE
MKYLSAFLIGAIFGIGIVVSGMGNPAKVQNFFDLFGSWDPSLAFVMGGALLVFLPGYALLVRPRQTPVLEPAFRLPQRTLIDARLIGGSAVFGIGWGIVGFCPGGAIPMLGTFDSRIFLFIVAMAAGMLIARFVSGMLADKQRAADVAASG